MQIWLHFKRKKLFIYISKRSGVSAHTRQCDMQTPVHIYVYVILLLFTNWRLTWNIFNVL